MPKEQTHYAVLGISPTATAGEVKKAYLKLALKTHPDKNKAPGAEEAFKLVNKAKEILTDAAQRRKYDGLLSPASPRRWGLNASLAVIWTCAGPPCIGSAMPRSRSWLAG